MYMVKYAEQKACPLGSPNESLHAFVVISLSNTQKGRGRNNTFLETSATKISYGSMTIMNSVSSESYMNVTMIMRTKNWNVLEPSSE